MRGCAFEDGLRLWRLVRFRARFDLVVEEAPLVAAREVAAAGGLAGVSAERRLAELAGLLSRPGARDGLALAHDLRLWPPTDACPPSEGVARLELARGLGDPPPLAAVLAALFVPLTADPALRTPSDEKHTPWGYRARDYVAKSLRGSRELALGVAGRVDAFVRLVRIAAARLEGSATQRSDRLRVLREEGAGDALRLAEAARPDLAAALAEFRAERSALTRTDLFPAPLLAAEDLAAAAIPRGPRWGELLREAEDAQLDGELRTREDALAWLAAQDGGNTRRSDQPRP